MKDFEAEQARYSKSFADHLKALGAWQAREDARNGAADAAAPANLLNTTVSALRRLSTKKRKSTDPKPEPPTAPRSRMQPEEPQLFLHLATALKILLSRTIDVDTLPVAIRHLTVYLQDFSEVHIQLTFSCIVRSFFFPTG